jgi:hypothetical protein
VRLSATPGGARSVGDVHVVCQTGEDGMDVVVVVVDVVVVGWAGTAGDASIPRRRSGRTRRITMKRATFDCLILPPRQSRGGEAEHRTAHISSAARRMSW